MKKIIIVLLVICAVTFVQQSGYAITIWGNEGGNSLGEFTGSLDYAASSDTCAILSISLTNTTPVGGGGSLTGFAFNNPDNLITVAVLFSTNYAGFSLLPNTVTDNGIIGAPYGAFDFGVLTGSNFLGGTSSSGILYNNTGNFVFNLTGTGFESLDEYSFVNETSDGDNEFFLVRIQSIDSGEGSDKVPGKAEDNPVPEPMTMLLLGPALLGLVGLKRRKA